MGMGEVSADNISFRSNRRCPPPLDSSPWLVFSHGGKSKSMKTQTFCTTNNKFFLKCIPELHGKLSLLCCHGWLLLRDETHYNSMSLWNPVSLQTIFLPPLPQEFDTSVCSSILTCPPEHEEGCFILLFGQELAAFCPLRGDRWVVQRTRIIGFDQEVTVTKAVACNGVLYGSVIDLSFYDNIVVIEINGCDGSNMSLTLRPLGRLDVPVSHSPSRRALSGLVESCGEVYGIHLLLDLNCRRVLEGQVWRLDLDRMAWVEVKTLKDRVFFSCNNYCISCPCATLELDSGGLYFVLPGDKTLYFYRVEDATVTAMLPCPKLKTPWLRPFWVLPCYARLMLTEKIHEHSVREIGEENKPNNPGDDNQDVELLVDVHRKGTQAKACMLCKLPQHVITLIAERLGLFDYLSFRSSCKEFRAAAPPIQWRRTPSLKLQNHNSPSPPLLVHLNNYRGDDDNVEPLLLNVIDPSRLDAQYPMSITKSFAGAVIVFSKKGWILTFDGKDTLQFLNPFTRVSGSYPPYENMGFVFGRGFSTTPTSRDCVTVGIDGMDDNIYICYFRYGDSTWSECRFHQDQQEFSFEPSCSSPVYHNGAFYFVDTKGHLGVFELKAEEGSWRVFDKPVPATSSSFYSSYIAECDGQLVVVVIGNMGKWLEVFRWIPEIQGWDKVESLGDQTLFVGPYSCFSAKATRPEMGNRVYVPRFYGSGVVFYSMESRKWHYVGNEETLSDFYGTRELLLCCWIQPAWSD